MPINSKASPTSSTNSSARTRESARAVQIGAHLRPPHGCSAGKYRYFVVYISTMRARRIAPGIARGPGSLHRSAVALAAHVGPVDGVLRLDRFVPGLVWRLELREKECLKSLVSRRATSLSIPLMALVKFSASRCR